MNIDCYTLMLVDIHGTLTPIGKGGDTKFHAFKHWPHAHGAIADVVESIGLDQVLAIAQTTVRRDGERVQFDVTHYSQTKVGELRDSFKSNAQRIKRSDGRSVRVTVPDDDHGDPSPSDGQL